MTPAGWASIYAVNRSVRIRCCFEVFEARNYKRFVNFSAPESGEGCVHQPHIQERASGFTIYGLVTIDRAHGGLLKCARKCFAFEVRLAERRPKGGVLPPPASVEDPRHRCACLQTLECTRTRLVAEISRVRLTAWGDLGKSHSKSCMHLVGKV